MVWLEGRLCSSKLSCSFSGHNPLPALRPSLPVWPSTFQLSLCLASSEHTVGFWLFASACMAAWGQPLPLPWMRAVDFPAPMRDDPSLGACASSNCPLSFCSSGRPSYSLPTVSQVARHRLDALKKSFEENMDRISRCYRPEGPK